MISMSLPNCLLLVSECILKSAEPWSRSGKNDDWLEVLKFVLARLVTGLNGISWASGCGMKFVMASMTRTLGILDEAAGVTLGRRVLGHVSERNWLRFQVGFSRSSER